jgi:hypothetical protein
MGISSIRDGERRRALALLTFFIVITKVSLCEGDD